MSISRRHFLEMGTIGAVATASGATPIGFNTEKETATSQQRSPNNPAQKLRLGLIGVGLRGRDHLGLLLDRKDCEVVAICDIDPAALAESQKLIAEKGGKKAIEFGKNEQDYKRLLEAKDIDAIVIATPWIWHTEMSINALKAGKYTAVEVCGGFSIDECWQLVNTCEETGNHLFFLENVCYRRDIMAVMNMVRLGMFGELMHTEGGYQHDLREVKFNDGQQPYGGGVEYGEKGFSEAKWRTLQSQHRNGDLYPTHGVGPVAMMLDINRGNRFMHLTSTASKARGLHDYIVNHPKGGANHPNAKVEWKLGDVVTSVIKCNNGESIILSHDTNLPRPYSLGFRVQGTKGIWMDVNDSLLLEGVTPAHRWEAAEPFLKKYDHPLWKKYEAEADGAGHGGMDFFVINAFVEGAKRNERPQIDVYDAAAWLAITPLSEMSIATGSAPQAFPDFTRGRWTEWTNRFAKNLDY